jgi:hypothetical protein
MKRSLRIKMNISRWKATAVLGGMLLAIAGQNVAFALDGSAGDDSAKVTKVEEKGDSMTLPKDIVPATTRVEAEAATKGKVGRNDPFSPIDGFKPFPTHGGRIYSVGKKTGMSLPPPPPGAVAVPPPPPNGDSLSASNYLTAPPPASSLNLSDLPLPPTRPSIVPKLKLTGIIDSKAIFSIQDIAARHANKWPKTVKLNVGDQFYAVKLVSISNDSVTLEENGSRTIKELEPIR